TEELSPESTLQTIQFAGEDIPADSDGDADETPTVEAVTATEMGADWAAGSVTTPISLPDAVYTDRVEAVVSDMGDTNAGAISDEGDVDAGAVHDEGDKDEGAVSDEEPAADEIAVDSASEAESAPVTSDISADSINSLSTTPITVAHLDAAPVTSAIVEAEVDSEGAELVDSYTPPEPEVDEAAPGPLPEPLYVPSYVPIIPAEAVQPEEPEPDVTESEPVPSQEAALVEEEPKPVYTEPESLYVSELSTPTFVIESEPPPPNTEPIQYYVPVYTPAPIPAPEPQPQQEAQPEVLSFDELFSWTATDDSANTSSQPYTPPVEPLQEQAAAPQGGYYTPTPSREQPSTPYVPAPVEPEAVKEPEPTVFTFDYSASQADTAAMQSVDVPSWNPDDDVASTPAPLTTQSGGWSPTPRPQPTESAVYQSYSQSSGSTGPQPIPSVQPVQPAFPSPGQRPKPGTPEYEEMARKALEGRIGSTSPTTSQVNTSPLSTPLVSSTPAYGYGQDSQSYSAPTTPEPIQPVQPAFPPPGQRPKPGTPEYEEMARQAMQSRGVSGSPANTSPLGAMPQQTTPSYMPDPTPSPAPPPPVQPSGQRPKPGTPEYEEMARKALEERARQQGT
ncbi:MAG: hypothetical protein ABIQ44_04370, partial [Chloroflexia bacterium]